MLSHAGSFFFLKMAPAHFEALDPSETVLYAWKLSLEVIYQNNKYPDGSDLTKKFYDVTLQIKKSYADT